jgi:eukaryotic-like serine/threonine-protein kinase
VPLPVPPDLESALAAAPAARATFDRLSPDAKDAWIQWVGRARSRRQRVRRTAYVAQRLGATPAETVEEAPPPLPPRQEWWPWLLVLALALIVAALLVWLLVYRNNDNGTHNTVVVSKGTVPNVVGRSQASAQQLVRRASLRPVVVKQPSAKVPGGTVLAQKPGAGVVLKSGSPVTLVISRGPPPVAVPSVQGLAAADAVAKVQQAKLEPHLVEKRSTKTAGSVIAQSPSAATKVKPGTRVTLTVSRGVGTVTVPAVEGESVAAATRELQAAGFKVQTANVTSDVPKGLVVRQTPRGGEAAKKGSAVKLSVSRGAPATTTTVTTTQQQTTTQQSTTTAPATTTQASGTAVPALTNKGLATALQQLETAGLRAAVKYQSSQTPLGRVLGQNPAAGTKVPPRTRVQLNVSEGPNPGNPTQVPDVTGEDEATARSDLESAGFTVIVIQRSAGGTSGNVVEQQPAAGTSIASGDYVAIYVAR